MNLSTAVIDGVLKLISHVRYNGKKENRIRVYNAKDSRVPEAVLFESKTNKGVFLDEVNDKQYQIVNGKLVGI